MAAYSGRRKIFDPSNVATFLVVSISAALLAAVCSAIGLLSDWCAKRRQESVVVRSRFEGRGHMRHETRTFLKCLMS